MRRSLPILMTKDIQINLELRNGSDHCQKNTVPFLKETLLLTHRLSTALNLLSMDSGNIAEDNLRICYERATRRESSDGRYGLAKAEGTLYQPREGKKIYIGSTYREIPGLGKVRIVYEVIERTSKANGQLFLPLDIEINTWWTSLTEPEKVVIKLYHDHGQSEQYHSKL
jgi:hypothetical protein